MKEQGALEQLSPVGLMVRVLPFCRPREAVRAQATQSLEYLYTSQDGLAVLYNKHPPKISTLKQGLSRTGAVPETGQQDCLLLSLRDPGRWNSSLLEHSHVTE